MAYKFTTGSVSRGDIHYEDDRAQTYIDFDDDKIALKANGITFTLDDTAPSWTACKLEGAALHINGSNLYLDNNKGVVWGDSSVLVMGNAITETLSIKANATTYFHLDGDASPGKIGIGTTTPGSFLQVSGSTAFNVTLFSSNSAVDETHHTLIGDCNGNSVTLTLPVATDAMAGREYTFKRADSGGSGGSNSLTIGRNGRAIDGDGLNDLILANDGDCFILQCVGSSFGWIVISKYAR